MYAINACHVTEHPTTIKEATGVTFGGFSFHRLLFFQLFFVQPINCTSTTRINMGNIDSLPEIELREEEGLLNIEQQPQLSPKCACVYFAL